MVALSLPVKKKRDFDPMEFLATIGEGRKVVAFPKKDTIFTQGEAADAVFYIQQGEVRLTVLSKVGKGATLGILSEGEFSEKVAWLASLYAWDRQRNDGLRTSANWEEGNDACATPGTHILGSFRTICWEGTSDRKRI